MSSLTQWLELVCKMVPDTQSAVLQHISEQANTKPVYSSWPNSKKPSEKLLETLVFSSQRDAVVTSYSDPYLIVSTHIPTQQGNYPFAIRVKVKEDSVEATKKLIQWSIRWLAELLNQAAEPSAGPSTKTAADSVSDASVQTSSLENTTSSSSWYIRWKYGLLALICCAILVFVPVNYRVAVDTVIEGKVQMAVVAPFDGYIKSATLSAGDTVNEGDVLAMLDDQPLRLEQLRLESQLQEYDKGYRKHLAGRDYGQANVAKAKRDQVQAQLNQASLRVEQAQLKAPMSGIIIKGDLTRQINAPVDNGDVLFEISPLNAYRAMLSVKEADIRFIKEGQSAELKLAALPNQIFTLTLLHATPLFDDQDGAPVYLAEAQLEDDDLNNLRPNMEGVSRVEVGKAPIGWVLFHHFIDWCRIQYWRWLL